MKHLKRINLINEGIFTPKEFVIYQGKRARVISKDDEIYTLMIMPTKKTPKERIEGIPGSDINPLPQCLGRCDRQVVDIPVEHGGGKGIYCYGCDRPIRRL